MDPADTGGAGGAWARTVADLEGRLATAFDALLGALAVDDARLDFRPAADAWTAREVLEHVTLADRYLLVLARKIAAKSARRLASGEIPPATPSRFEPLEALARRVTPWNHPAHMTPTVGPGRDALARALAADRAAALALLGAQPAGEGALHRIRMSMVAGDDRLDLYQYLAVVALHAERHAAQLARNRAAFEALAR